MWWKAALAVAAVMAVGPQSTNPEWSAHEVEVLRSLSIRTLGPPPPDPSNRVADDPSAAALGRALFSDARFSSNGRVSCASCHRPANGFTDALPTGRGVGTGTRRTMPLAQAVHSPWQFWDGRADSLWAQALGPVENPLEHGFTRTEVVRLLASQYRRPYEQLFGPLPDLSDRHRFPVHAAPGGDRKARAAWSAMQPEDRQTVDRIYSNFGKAIAAFERTLPVGPTRFDKYVAGVTGEGPAAALSPSETAGLRLFIGKARCSTCHNGPMLSNEGFANTGVPARNGLPLDAGRIAGARKALADPFNCKGAFSDAHGHGQGCDELEFMVVNDAHQVRAYKVPSLRGVGRRAPYMHAGQFTSLGEVIDHYNRAPLAQRGTSELKPLHLTQRERSQLLSFLMTLDDQPQPAAVRNGARHDR
jgi:cytochrome c peroxidase